MKKSKCEPKIYPPVLHDVYLDKFVAQVMKSCDWQAVSPECLSVLTEIASNLMNEIAKKSILFVHHAGRTSPSFSDVYSGIRECGIDMKNIHLSKALPKLVNIIIQPTEKPPTVVKITTPLPQPPYIPTHMNLPFPQPHTYIKTPTYNLPVSSYSSLREARARQRNEVLNSLSKQLVLSSTSIQLIPGRDDCAWASPELVDPLDYLITHHDDRRVKRKKRKTVSSNVYMQAPKCTWAGLFTS